jgi:hypothetical protein
MQDHDAVSHSDIYRALGILEGKLDSLSTQLNQKHGDLTAAFGRITDLEKNMAKAMGIAIACSVILPLVITLVSSRIVSFDIQPTYIEERKR